MKKNNLYAVCDQVMNGTFTINTITCAIQADNFLDAKEKLIKIWKSRKKQGITFKISTNDDRMLCYHVTQEGSMFPVMGKMENVRMAIIK